MKLNGWKLIGIVVSLAWILGAGYYTITTDEAARTQYAASLTLGCEEAHNGQGNPECDARSTDYLAAVGFPWPEAAMAAFVPVPFAWGAVYLLLFLVHWIRKGFVDSCI